MEDILIYLGKTLILSWLVTRYEPIQWVIDTIPSGRIKSVIQDATTCMKCMSLYIGLLISGSIYVAALASLLSVFYNKTIGEWEQKVKFKK
jgi:hypothetical protein